MSEVPQTTGGPSAQPEKIEDEAPKRFVEQGPQAILDTQTGIYWLKKDSWQDKGKFLNWHEARDYVETKNMRSVGGFDDWRLPTPDEAKTLFDKTRENPGKGGVTLHLDPAFPEGAFKTMWTTGDTSTRRPRLDLTEGKLLMAEEYSFGSTRLCRKGPVDKGNSSRGRRR
ncbi:MAG: DUF1566 domain-containing protein [Nitrospinales bacterium]